MSGKGALGWLILMVALAVPAFMFWNWWKLLNNKPREGSRPAQGPVFEKTQMAGNLQNPLNNPGAQAGNPPAGVDASSAAATAAPAQPGAAAPVAQNSSAPGTANAAETPAPPPGAQPAAPPHAAPPDGAMAQAPTPPPSDPAAPPPAPMAAAALAEPGLRYQPKVHRDPMLSPMDIKKLAEIALEEEDRKRREQDELERLKRKPTKVKVAAPPIETLVNLYGITAVPGSITAIVEVLGGESQVVRPGDRLSNGVRIMKITQTTVYFQYKAKKWARTISK